MFVSKQNERSGLKIPRVAILAERVKLGEVGFVEVHFANRWSMPDRNPVEGSYPQLLHAELAVFGERVLILY